ncbi:MAG TPA: hypothetical protein VJ725_11575 [Thermoanaerobaculia bacterium]|nr:hypothetical protein [Thermoanaerobaculia bacterium]
MSTVIGTLPRSRRFGLLGVMIVLLAVVGLSLSQAPAALAATLQPVHCIYYSDATYTVAVGEVYYSCTTRVQYGTATNYRVCDDYDYCCGNWWC